jgi:hypothetical protein
VNLGRGLSGLVDKMTGRKRSAEARGEAAERDATPAPAPSISDGTSNTVVVGEEGGAGSTGVRDAAVDQRDDEVAGVVVGDGSVRFVGDTIDPAVGGTGIADGTSNTVVVGEASATIEPSPAPTLERTPAPAVDAGLDRIVDGTSNTLLVGEAADEASPPPAAIDLDGPEELPDVTLEPEVVERASRGRGEERSAGGRAGADAARAAGEERRAAAPTPTDEAEAAVTPEDTVAFVDPVDDVSGLDDAQDSDDDGFSVGRIDAEDDEVIPDF